MRVEVRRRGGPTARPQWFIGLEADEPLPQPHTPLPHPALSGSAAIPMGLRSAVVPKGVRSFDAGDAGFFLHLLPGPRRDGLPESIHFWKGLVEEPDEPTFTVGVLYGPSGCGKSSLVKAGLLPRLAVRIGCVYVAATAAGTEAGLRHGLRRRCPQLPEGLSLIESLTALRQGRGRRLPGSSDASALRLSRQVGAGERRPRQRFPPRQDFPLNSLCCAALQFFNSLQNSTRLNRPSTISAP
jgi:hypothetical protein